ncbi:MULTISPECIES: peptidoglycan editing factor PgeF [unclassified Brevundimonas]|uniref:peptidoglycan editing factor PgeF n=1 Tax=unclassified Brevundimonas TaxID=2622653 RepID=UPI0006FC8628|nr:MULTISPECIES: peptidoglycan editing factor PgeF [unclassified Brevundimonas]KQY68957.1 polyphenol oxidase [Brevundimonas sp. Root1423]KRA29039.1 polyphenol oxidase [Brevundimonas sp. Root608]
MTLEPITHSLLDKAGVRHGFFTRQGGVSTGIYASLNTGVGSTDYPAAVAENRRRVAAHMGGVPDDFAACYQIHSSLARVAEAGWKGDRPEGDATVTAAPSVICAVLTADCAPVLLADPEAGIVGAAHAGWKGALDGVIHSTVAAMQALGAEPRRMVAVVGPCIAQASYEVGADFQGRFDHHDPGSGRFFAPGAAPDKRLFDLPGFVLWRLEQAGVGDAAWTGHDTRVDEVRFFSNRRAWLNGEPDFGRMMSAISLR